MDVADSEKYHHGLLLLWKRVGWVEVTPKQYRNEQLGRTMGVEESVMLVLYLEMIFY